MNASISGLVPAGTFDASLNLPARGSSGTKLANIVTSAHR
jgi:hypothetical protein